MGAQYRDTYRVVGHLSDFCRRKFFLVEKRGYPRLYRRFNAHKRGVERIMVPDLLYAEAFADRKYRDNAQPDRRLCIDNRYFKL